MIPKYPVQQYVGELEFDEITLEVYFKSGKEKSILYEDAQDGYDYNKGRFSLSTFRLKGSEDNLVIQQFKEGKFEVNYSKYRINLHALPFKVKRIYIDNERADFEPLGFDGKTLLIDKDFTELHITAE
jgi:alpha-glucosidase